MFTETQGKTAAVNKRVFRCIVFHSCHQVALVTWKIPCTVFQMVHNPSPTTQVLFKGVAVVLLGKRIGTGRQIENKTTSRKSVVNPSQFTRLGLCKHSLCYAIFLTETGARLWQSCHFVTHSKNQRQNDKTGDQGVRHLYDSGGPFTLVLSLF